MPLKLIYNFFPKECNKFSLSLILPLQSTPQCAFHMDPTWIVVDFTKKGKRVNKRQYNHGQTRVFARKLLPSKIKKTTRSHKSERTNTDTLTLYQSLHH